MENDNSLDSIAVKTMVADVKKLMQCRPDDGLRLRKKSSKRELIELLHYVFLSSDIREDDGEACTFNSIVSRVFSILHIPHTANPNAYINGIEIRRMRNESHRLGVLDKYKFLISRGELSPIRAFVSARE